LKSLSARRNKKEKLLANVFEDYLFSSFIFTFYNFLVYAQRLFPPDGGGAGRPGAEDLFANEVTDKSEVHPLSS
jgi:hypothetical protein